MDITFHRHFSALDLYFEWRRVGVRRNRAPGVFDSDGGKQASIVVGVDNPFFLGVICYKVVQDIFVQDYFSIELLYLYGNLGWYEKIFYMVTKGKVNFAAKEICSGRRKGFWHFLDK